MLNRINNTLAYAKISQGGTVGTVVDPKIIGKYAVDSLAQSVIIIHNHPTGHLLPSKEDINLTNKLREGLTFLEITLLDHIILTKDSYFSFGDEGLI